MPIKSNQDLAPANSMNQRPFTAKIFSNESNIGSIAQRQPDDQINELCEMMSDMNPSPEGKQMQSDSL